MSQLTGLVGQAGQLLALAPLAAMLHATSWEIVFGGIAGLCVFGILVWAVIRNHPPQLRADVSVDTNTGAIRVVRSSMDTGVGIRAAWAHPGTRLAFWSHFTAPFAGTAFVLLWGTPFLTAGEGLSLAQAAGVLSTYVVVAWPSDRSWATSRGAFPTCVRGRSCSRRWAPSSSRGRW
jgi:hypothetical protein